MRGLGSSPGVGFPHRLMRGSKTHNDERGENQDHDEERQRGKPEETEDREAAGRSGRSSFAESPRRER
jgi:hypothetical protein